MPIDIHKEVYDAREDLTDVLDFLTATEDDSNGNLAAQKCKKYSKYSFKGDSPLHVAMKHGKNHLADLVQLLVKMHPNACRETNNEGELPIHRLHAKNSSESNEVFESIKLLLKAYPEALHIVCSRERLPFSHLKTSSKLTKYLIENHPQWVKTEDGLGNLPVHWACRGGNLEAVKMCVDAYPAGLEHKNDDDRLPLHYAVAADDPKLVEVIAGKYPEAVKMPDSNTGLLPIIYSKSVGTVSALAKACPEVFDVACSCPSQDGADALNYASCHCLTNHPIVQYLEESKFDKSGSDRVQVMLKYCNATFAGKHINFAKIRKLEEELEIQQETEALTNKNNGAKIKQLHHQLKAEAISNELNRARIKDLEDKIDTEIKTKESAIERITALEDKLETDVKSMENDRARIKELEDHLEKETSAKDENMMKVEVLKTQLDAEMRANARSSSTIEALEEELKNETMAIEGYSMKIEELEVQLQLMLKCCNLGPGTESDSERIKELENQVEMDAKTMERYIERIRELEDQVELDAKTIETISAMDANTMERYSKEIKELENKVEMNAKTMETINAKDAKTMDKYSERIKELEDQIAMDAKAIGTVNVQAEELHHPVDTKAKAMERNTMRIAEGSKSEMDEAKCDDGLTEIEKFHQNALEKEICSHRNTKKILTSLRGILRSKMSEEDFVMTVLESGDNEGLTMDDINAVVSSLTSRVTDLEESLTEIEESRKDALGEEIRSHCNTQKMLASLQSFFKAKTAEEDLLTKVLESDNSEGLSMENLKAVMSSLLSRLIALRSKLNTSRKRSTAQKLAKYMLSARDDELDREDILDNIFAMNKEVLESEQMNRSISCSETELSTLASPCSSATTAVSISPLLNRKSRFSCISQVPFFLRSREDGYVTHDPVSGMHPVLASNEKMLPPSLHYLEAKNSKENVLATSGTITDRQMFYKELSGLIGKEVAIKKEEAKSGNYTYLTSRGRKKTGMKKKIHRAIYEEEKEYFILERGSTGGFTLKTVAKKKGKKGQYLYWSQSADQIQAVTGTDSGILHIKKSPLQFSDQHKLACEWVIDPDLAPVSLLKSHGRPGGNVLFLGVTDGDNSEIEMSLQAM